MHTLLDLRGNIPSFIKITNGKVGDMNILDELIPEPGSYYVMDRAYLDYSRLSTLGQCLAFFVTRAKRNLQFRRIVLVAILKKRLHLDLSLYTILQVLSITIFEKEPLLQVLTDFNSGDPVIENPNQLVLFKL